MLEEIAQDIRYGLRTLAKSYGFTTVAVLTLALGIGANSAIFSFVDGVLLKPLPYPDPERILQVWESRPAAGTTACPRPTSWIGSTRAMCLRRWSPRPADP